MLFLENLILLIDCRKHCSSHIDFLSVIGGQEFVRMEPGNVLAIGCTHSARFHQFVHAHPRQAMPLPQDIRQGAKKHPDVILLRVTDPLLQALPVLLTSLVASLLTCLLSGLDLLDSLSAGDFGGVRLLSVVVRGCAGWLLVGGVVRSAGRLDVAKVDIGEATQTAWHLRGRGRRGL